MIIDEKKIEAAKAFLKKTTEQTKIFTQKIIRSSAVQKTITALKWTNLSPRLIQAKDIVVSFTKQQPKTAAFIYVCLFCAFSIGYLDEALARSCFKMHETGFWSFLVKINPAGWWFGIFIALWLFYMASAGLSLTTEAFEKDIVKARSVLVILLALSISSLFTLILNILTGRYSPEFLETMNLYGFSAFRFRVSETSFPSFDAQSIWVVALASGAFLPRFKLLFRIIAGFITAALALSADCFLSDAVMGTYIGIIFFYAAGWIVSENRENFPLVSL